MKNKTDNSNGLAAFMVSRKKMLETLIAPYEAARVAVDLAVKKHARAEWECEECCLTPNYNIEDLRDLHEIEIRAEDALMDAKKFKKAEYALYCSAKEQLDMDIPKQWAEEILREESHEPARRWWRSLLVNTRASESIAAEAKDAGADME